VSADASSEAFPVSEGRGIRGHLRLVCGPDSRGFSSLREQSFRAPIHLSKPHLDAETLVVNVVNPTAGLLQDDRIEQDVRVKQGASLLLTSPSASRAHRVRTGWAEVSQHFHVAAGAALEVLPETFIPQAGASF
jgi:urease accessory protein